MKKDKMKKNIKNSIKKPINKGKNPIKANGKAGNFTKTNKKEKAVYKNIPNVAITGIFQEGGSFASVIPDDRREMKEIMVLQGSEAGAQNGDRVIIELTPHNSYRSIKKNSGIEHMGKIMEVLGASSDPKTAVIAVIRRLGLRQEFSSKQLEAATKLNKPVTVDDGAGRADLRNRLLVTIDGEDTRDIDDAISLECLSGEMWRLGVHIADVSHYVKEGSWLDREAFIRSTSVYFPDLVLPMLPKDLSNGICSLNAGEDRLAMSCIMTINKSGKLVSYTIEPTLIKVKEKLSYPQVQGYLNKKGWTTKAALTGQGGVLKHDQKEQIYFNNREIEPMILEMAKLSVILRKNRFTRGAINFDFPEAKIKMADDGKVEDIIRKDRMLSEMIIEEFMILANETVATHYHKRLIPFLYRVHETPALENIKELNHSLSAFGLSVNFDPYQRGQKESKVSKSSSRNSKKIKSVKAQGEVTTPKYGSTVSPQAFQKVLALVKGKPEEPVVSTLLLRSLAHARYSPKALGHFGLASPYYSHFTSPIRRYADLAIHRVIKSLGMEGRLSEDDKQKSMAKMERYGEQTSLCERVAEEAERKVDDLKKAEYMSRFIGDEFAGVISGVTNYGLYIALENTVEGLVHISCLDDYYEFDEKQFCLYGVRSHNKYSLGDKVKVRLIKVNALAGFVDFEMVEKSKNEKVDNKKNNGKKPKNSKMKKNNAVQ